MIADMRQYFRGYYAPSDEDFDELTKSATIVFDTNVLLDLYRRSPVREVLLDFMQANRGRLWLPHQVASEYHKHRVAEMLKQRGVYDELRESLTDAKSKVIAKINGYTRHLSLDVEELADAVTKCFDGIESTLSAQQNSHKDMPLGTSSGPFDDEVLSRLTAIYEDRVGPKYDNNAMEVVIKEGERRYAKQIPPGYADVGKPDDQRYGDLIIWRQMIDFAKAHSGPLLFVTGDTKEDWWLRVSGKTISPRPELVAEMYDEANVLWYMYSLEQFIDQVIARLDTDSDRSSIIKDASAIANRDATLDQLRAYAFEIAAMIATLQMRSAYDVDRIRRLISDRDGLLAERDQIVSRLMRIDSRLYETRNIDPMVLPTAQAHERHVLETESRVLAMHVENVEARLASISSELNHLPSVEEFPELIGQGPLPNARGQLAVLNDDLARVQSRIKELEDG